jgi:hypothetical protein
VGRANIYTTGSGTGCESCCTALRFELISDKNRIIYLYDKFVRAGQAVIPGKVSDEKERVGKYLFFVLAIKSLPEN